MTVTCSYSIVVTQSSVPMHPPNSAIIDKRQTDGSIIVMWRLLSLEEARGFITGYTVTAQQADFGLVLRQTPKTMEVLPNVSNATIRGLDPKHAYTITLSANTSQGGNFSSTLIQPSGESRTILNRRKFIIHFLYTEKLFSHLAVSGAGILAFVIVAVLILIISVLLVCIFTRYIKN